MTDKKVIPTKEATAWNKLTGQAKPTREATTFEKLTDQATPTREATWWENLTQGGSGNFSGSFGTGAKLGRLTVIVLTIVFCIPGLILNKLLSKSHGTGSVWLYALLFWSLVGGTVYLERNLETSMWFFGILMVLISLLNIVLGLASSGGFLEPRLSPAAQTFFAKSKPSLPWIGWFGFILGMFSLIWSLAAHWPPSTLLPGLIAIVAGIVLVRSIPERAVIIKFCLGMVCISAALFQLSFGWMANLTPTSQQGVHASGNATTQIAPTSGK